MVGTSLLRHLHRNQRRFSSLCGEFQEQRFTCVAQLATIRLLCLNLRLPGERLHLPALPLYRFVKADGILRMAVRHAVEGGSGVYRGAQVRISLEQAPETAVLHVTGELDLTTAQLLSNAIARAYRLHRSVVIDLSQLDYLDRSAIRVLERAASENPRHFAVVASRPAVHNVFTILMLIETLPVIESVEAAKAYLQRQ